MKLEKRFTGKYYCGKLWVYLSIKIRIETWKLAENEKEQNELWVYLSIKIRIETEAEGITEYVADITLSLSIH